MMLDEPYRFAEAVANRRDYIEDQLRGGSPVVGVTYSDGILLLTLGRGQQKLYETYDRIAMGSVGHPTDIETLRQSAVDLASVVGFNYSEADVTLQQIVHFGLGPAVKASFDDIIRSPYIARILLAELDSRQGSLFYTVDYDGSFTTYSDYAVVGGSLDADDAMYGILKSNHDPNAALPAVLEVALRAWAAGRKISLQDESSGEEEVAVEDADVSSTLREAVEDLTVEAIVLNRARAGKSKYQALASEDTQPAIEAVLG
jgi:proteasome alpha subunit